eukprot:32365-Rhodomonas_salina.1
MDLCCPILRGAMLLLYGLMLSGTERGYAATVWTGTERGYAGTSCPISAAGVLLLRPDSRR